MVLTLSIFFLHVELNTIDFDIVVNLIEIIVFFSQFEKPGRRDDFDYPQMAQESVSKALNDSKVSYKDVQQACVGYVYGENFQSFLIPVFIYIFLVLEYLFI